MLLYVPPRAPKFCKLDGFPALVLRNSAVTQRYHCPVEPITALWPGFDDQDTSRPACTSRRRRKRWAISFPFPGVTEAAE